MTTGTAENLASRGVEKKEEKVEKRKALGRGLESLLPGPRVVVPASDPRPLSGERVSGTYISAVQAVTAPPAETSTLEPIPAPQAQPHDIPPVENIVSISAPASPANVVNLALDLIDKNPYQTRQLFHEDQLAELRDSIREHGVVQPVVVRPAQDERRYILVLGERRLRASRMAGNERIPALVRRLSPQQAAEMTVLENVVREDLNPMEQAEAYRVLSQEFKLTQGQIAERIGVARESVANYLRLLRLPEEIKEHVAHGRISFSQAREILALESREHILMVAEDLLAGRLRWDELRDRIARLNSSLPPLPASDRQSGGARWIDPNVKAAQLEMERLLGVRVKIKDRNGKGKIVIEYASVDDYERVIDMLRGASK
jgi:ParB family transcriptional regulator, chromosome partitioning protein